MSDLRDALAERLRRSKALKRVEEAKSSPDHKDNPRAEKVKVSGPPTVLEPIDDDVASAKAAPSASSSVEGFLSKLSSGDVTSRWQRRYFILDSEGLSYSKSKPSPRSTSSKLKIVFPKGHIRTVQRLTEVSFMVSSATHQLQLQANSGNDAFSWISTLSNFITTQATTATPTTPDSSAHSSTEPESMEHLDESFTDWFEPVIDGKTCPKPAAILDACSCAIADMSANFSGGDILRADRIAGEYFTRLEKWIRKWINRRIVDTTARGHANLPALIEFFARSESTVEARLAGSDHFGWRHAASATRDLLVEEVKQTYLADLRSAIPPACSAGSLPIITSAWPLIYPQALSRAVNQAADFGVALPLSGPSVSAAVASAVVAVMNISLAQFKQYLEKLNLIVSERSHKGSVMGRLTKKFPARKDDHDVSLESLLRFANDACLLSEYYCTAQPVDDFLANTFNHHQFCFSEIATETAGHLVFLHFSMETEPIIKRILSPAALRGTAESPAVAVTMAANNFFQRFEADAALMVAQAVAAALATACIRGYLLSFAKFKPEDSVSIVSTDSQIFTGFFGKICPALAVARAVEPLRALSRVLQGDRDGVAVLISCLDAKLARRVCAAALRLQGVAPKEIELLTGKYEDSDDS